MKNRCGFIFIFFICFWVLLFSGQCIAGSVKVGTWKTAQTIQPFFYDRFMDTKNQIRIFSFTNPADQKTALLSGTLDMCGTTLAHAIHSASLDQPVVVVAALCNKCSALVIRKGGTVRQVADLEGKKVGYVPGTMHEILLRETLTRNGLSPALDVKLTRVDFFDMGLALAKGDIHAFLSGEPFPTIAVLQGYGEIMSYPYYGDTIGAINAGMLVKLKTIRENPGLVLELVRAHARATRFLNQNTGDWLKKAASFGTDETVLKHASANMELAWQMDDAYVEKARALGERMQTLGVIKKQPDYHRLFDLSFVKQAQKLIQDY